MNRLAIVFLGLSLSCASSAPKKKTADAPELPTPAWEGGDRDQEAAPAREYSSGKALPMEELPFAEAKERADQLWIRADKLKTNAPAWEDAAEALALAAKAKAEDPALAAPLLKGALAAWSKSDKILEHQSGTKTAVTQRQGLPHRDALQVRALVQLAALTDPQSSDLAMVVYRHGRILYRHAHFLEAAEQFSIIVERFPDRQEAKYAASLLLDALQLSGATRELVPQVEEMLKNRVLVESHPELTETLLLLRHFAGKDEARKLVDSQSYQACADSYLALFSRDQKLPSVRGDELLHNASVCLERSRQTKRAIEVLRNLVRLYPESQFAVKASERAQTLAVQP